MDMKSLRLFVRAAETLNISKAGRELGMAPAAASIRLAKLEKELETDLLHRTTRKVSLSVEGAELLPYAREILAQEGAAKAALGLGSAQVSGTLRFAASSTFAQLYVIPIIQEFLERHPGVKLDLKLSDTPFDLIEGSFDLALRSSVPDDSGLKGRKLAEDKRILCASPAYLERHGTPSGPDSIASHQLIAFRDQTPKELIGPDGKRTVLDFRQSGCRIICDDGLSQKLAILAGVGIGFSSFWCVHKEIADGSLVRVLPDYDASEQTIIWIIYPQSNVLTAKVRVFIDFLVEKIARSPSWSGP